MTLNDCTVSYPVRATTSMFLRSAGVSSDGFARDSSTVAFATASAFLNFLASNRLAGVTFFVAVMLRCQ